MIGMSTVAEVQAGHIHTRIDQCPDHLRGVGRRTKSADDLPASIHKASIVGTASPGSSGTFGANGKPVEPHRSGDSA